MNTTNDKHEIHLSKPYATIQETKILGDDHNDDMVRVYCELFPDVFKFQIRTYKPIGEYGTGKSRNMIATVSLTRDEVAEILDQMNHYASNGEFID